MAVSEDVDPYVRTMSGTEAPGPGWDFVWTVAIMGAALGCVAVLVSSGDSVGWTLAWPLIPLVTVAVEHRRRRRRTTTERLDHP